MAKKSGGGKTRQLNEVKITAKAPKKANSRSVTTFGEVPTRKIDSLKKVGYGKAIGSGYKDAGGMTRYGSASSDAIKAGLRGGKKK